MQRIKEIVFFISKKVIELIPLSFEKVYYEKMEYSEKNTILDSDVKTLRETIAFEVAFIHVISFLVSRKIPKLDYLELLKFVDKDEIYSWYEIDDNEVKTELDKIDLSFDDISALINKHDTFVDKDIKKKLGQFYTPVSIAQKMVLEIKDELKSLTDIDALVDPACGTGVFIVETIKLMSTFMSLPQLCMTVQNNLEMIVIAIMGGISAGIGYGLIYRSGFSTGGTDVLGLLVCKYTKISMGTAMMFVNILILSLKT